MYGTVPYGTLYLCVLVHVFAKVKILEIEINNVDKYSFVQDMFVFCTYLHGRYGFVQQTIIIIHVP